MTIEQEFEIELEIFRTETEGASQFLFGYFAVHSIASDRQEVFQLLNTAPRFWNTALAALQMSAHIALGRIFDQRSSHNVDKALRLAQQNRHIFSKESLRNRKLASSMNASEWIDDYINTSYEPTVDDFRRLRAHVARRRKIYEANYSDIRNKVFAHKENADAAAINTLFSKGNVRELRRLFVFFQSLYESLWQLYQNGRKPQLRPQRHSVKRMRDLPSPGGGFKSVQEDITHDAERFLLAAAKEQA